MSARVLSELEKSDSIRGLPSILSRFATSLIKKKSSGTRMLDSINHMTLTLL